VRAEVHVESNIFLPKRPSHSRLDLLRVWTGQQLAEAIVSVCTQTSHSEFDLGACSITIAFLVNVHKQKHCPMAVINRLLSEGGGIKIIS